MKTQFVKNFFDEISKRNLPVNFAVISPKICYKRRTSSAPFN